MAMERSEIKYILTAALDRLNRDLPDTATWADVQRAVKDARERKVKESLTSIVGGYNLADLSTALSIACDETATEAKSAAFAALVGQPVYGSITQPPAPASTPVATLISPSKPPVPKKRK